MRNTLCFLLACCFVAWFAPSVVGQDKKDTKQRPNIVIIIADDVGWNDLGCYGHPHIRTPNLDKLAKEGMRFTAAFLTTSSCSPSRCSIMTGRYPHSTGAPELHQPLPANQVVFAGLLKRAGYYTASVGKWHLGNAAKENFDAVVQRGGPSGCKNWVKVLKERPRQKPFFLWLAAVDAHRPYAKNAIAKPHTPKDVVVPPFLPDNRETRKDLALYYDEITRMDDYIGRVMAELAQQGVAENTIVIFISDNGRPFPRCKTTLYDSGIKTPFIVRWPGHVDPGTVCNNLVSVVDIAPSMIEIAGLRQSPTFQGRSFVKMLKDPKAKIRDYVHGEHNWHDFKAYERAVRSSKYLYIKNAVPEVAGTPPADAVRSPTYQTMIKLHANGKLPKKQQGCFLKPRPTEELYDIRKDPFCLNNLATSKKHSYQLRVMRAQLLQWKRATNDRVPEMLTPDKFDRVTGKRVAVKKK
ncbi:MAG: sulfatase [Gemmataceae bacterium]